MSLPLGEPPDLSMDEWVAWLKLPWQDRVTIVAYFDNVGHLPQNFPEGSEAYDQWTYTGRKKKDKQTLQQAMEEK